MRYSKSKDQVYTPQKRNSWSNVPLGLHRKASLRVKHVEIEEKDKDPFNLNEPYNTVGVLLMILIFSAMIWGYTILGTHAFPGGKVRIGFPSWIPTVLFIFSIFVGTYVAARLTQKKFLVTPHPSDVANISTSFLFCIIASQKMLVNNPQNAGIALILMWSISFATAHLAKFFFLRNPI